MRFDELVAGIQMHRPELKLEQRNDGCSIWLSDGVQPARRLVRVNRASGNGPLTIKRAVSSLHEGKDVLLNFDGSVDDFLDIVDAELALARANVGERVVVDPTGAKVSGKLLDGSTFRSEIEALFSSPPARDVENWFPRLQQYLGTTRGSSAIQLQDKAFLKELFDSDHVSATGMCTIRSAPAIENEDFVSWFSNAASQPLSTDPQEAAARLVELHDEIAVKFRELCGKRPFLKINRALCALFPEYFTTLADEGKLTELYRALGGKGRTHVIHMHIAIRKMVEDILGPAEPGSLDAVKQMCVPWLLYRQITDDKEAAAPQSEAAPASGLVPMPAVLRRKGLTAIKGYFQTLLGYLPALSGDGLADEDFRDLIRESNPTLVDSSIRTTINVVMREFDLCRRSGDVYQLTARGINLLESQDPQELADQLLTKILGVDYVIRTLATNSKSKAELVALLQTVNPGWTTAFAPTALLGWLMSMRVISYEPTSGYALTEVGHQWNELITWQPPTLPKATETVVEIQTVVDANLTLPDWATVSQRLAEAGAGSFKWDKGLVEQLHGGLWFHPVRHFAVMAGLSGSGKTQLALNYANALCGPQPTGQESVKVLPVQPGWFDTSPLLGYVHPIQQSMYVGTPFLDLLLRAAENPTTPYVAILDEMNLSHPEQYLAPILSAMETHGVIDLHQMDEEVSGVPSQIRYPANLAIIGTVNMDETTHGLSDKVLDRAFTLEFWKIDVENFPKWGALEGEEIRAKTKAVLAKLMEVLEPVRLHFGWRTIDDVVSYLAFSRGLGINPDKALDDVLYAKVLPKLRGEHSERFVKAIAQTQDICQGYGLARCASKVQEMVRDLGETGSTRFWR
jgi:5-methylcytosine-specific restriction enzyme B